MSDSYYKAPDLDSLFPKPVPAVEVVVPSRDPEAEKRSADALHSAVQLINEELGRIRGGTSRIVLHAVSFAPEKTPFCLVLKLMDMETAGDRFNLERARKHQKQVIDIARQDFGEQFANFVAGQINPVFEAK